MMSDHNPKQVSQKVIDQAVKDIAELRETHPTVHFEVTLDMAFAVISFLQFALKHHTLKTHPSHVLAEGFSRQIAYQITATRAIAEVIEAGWEGPEGLVS